MFLKIIITGIVAFYTYVFTMLTAEIRKAEGKWTKVSFILAAFSLAGGIIVITNITTMLG